MTSTDIELLEFRADLMSRDAEPRIEILRGRIASVASRG